MDAAPRSPAYDIKRFCFIPHLKGLRIRKTAIGLATKVINKAINNADNIICGILLGYAKSPNKKNVIICAKLVTPSKNGIITFLFFIGLFPRIIPKRYTLKNSLPLVISDKPNI